MTTRTSRGQSRRATFENLLVVWLASTVGPGFVLALTWLGVGRGRGRDLNHSRCGRGSR